MSANRIAVCLGLAIGATLPAAEFAGCVPVRVNRPAGAAEALKGTPFTCALADLNAAELLVLRPGREARGERIPVRPREQWNRAATAPVVAISDGVWPGIRVTDQAVATPSTEPWIDANTWIVRSARAWSGSRPVWLTHAPPKQAGEQDCLRALAEVAAAGGYWTPPLEAVERWPSIAQWARFFEEHAAWRGFAPAGALGIVQDSLGKDLAVSGEHLNLIARRGIPYRVIERPGLSLASLAGLRVLLASDLAPPTDSERKILNAFAARGGEVIDGSKGSDPEELSKEMIDLVGYDEVGVRVYNAPSVMNYLTQADGGRRLLLHLINYATAPAEGVLVRVKGEFSRARLYRPGGAPVDIGVRRSTGRTEASIPAFPVYAAIMWEGVSDERKP